MSKKTTKNRGVSKNFIKEVSEKLNLISQLSKDSGVEIPNELEETLKELSVSSKLAGQLSSEDCSGDKDPSIEFPAPSESSVLEESSCSIKELKLNNNMLCRAVKEKLEEFKSLNKQSRNDGIKATKELKNYQTELKDMKSSVVEIIDEANSTKEQILKMKEKIEQENREFDSLKYEEYDMSTYKGAFPDSSNVLIDQIKELHQEIFKIQNRIEKSEQDLREKEMENKELKVIIEKLNESFERIGNETEEPPNSCQNCLIY